MFGEQTFAQLRTGLTPNDSFSFIFFWGGGGGEGGLGTSSFFEGGGGGGVSVARTVSTR